MCPGRGRHERLRLPLPLFLLIQRNKLSPLLSPPPLPLESSPGFPAASLPFLADWARPRPAAPAVTAAASTPRQPALPATRGSARPVPRLQSGSRCCPTGVRVLLLRRRRRLARSPRPPRQPGVGGEGTAGGPREDNAPSSRPPPLGLVLVRLIPAAPCRLPAAAPLPTGGIPPRPESLGRQQHQHQRQHQPGRRRRPTRRGRRLPQQ